jgi:guanosine-3',5'-bis(diphosphate) 3'-pyrophosphohydrolase
LKVRPEDVVDLLWRFKETEVDRPQHLFVEEAARNRILMMVDVTPDKMKVAVIITLSRIDTQKPPGRLIFR